jgi:hypothetical protein
MDYLGIKEEIIKSKKILFINNYNYDCFDLLNEYLDIRIYYNLVNSIEDHRLKNIWNHTILRWNNMRKELISDPIFEKSIYNKKYDFIKINITCDKINDELKSFIDNDLMKGLFVINCIQNYFYK